MDLYALNFETIVDLSANLASLTAHVWAVDGDENTYDHISALVGLIGELNEADAAGDDHMWPIRHLIGCSDYNSNCIHVRLPFHAVHCLDVASGYTASTCPGVSTLRSLRNVR